MSITDELREWAHGFNGPWRRNEEMLLAIADRIDAEHESACAEAYGNGVMSVPIALDESQWVKLPVDADGEHVHIGDVMEWCDSGDTLEVIGIGADDTLFYFDKDSDGEELADWTSARNKRHYHAPTVEDVLREFAALVRKEQIELASISDDAIAEYAAKLCLAEEVDG